MTILQTKRFSEETQTADNRDINDVTPKIWKTIEKPLVRHGFITALVSGSAALTTPKHEPELIHVLATPFGSFIAIPAENTKVLLRDWRQTILLDVIHRRRTRKLICNS